VGDGSRQTYSSGQLFALTTSAMRMAVAGEDRTVVAYDLRKPSAFIGTWASCLKYEVCAVQHANTERAVSKQYA